MIDLGNDHHVLSTMLVLVFLLLLLLFIIGPCYRPAVHLIVTQLKTVPAAITKITRHRARPAVYPPPVEVASTPTALPTPEGGGFRKIVFASNRADGHYIQLYIMDADGRHLERLIHSRGFDRDPHLATNGRDIAFVSNRWRGIYQIFLLDLETRVVRQLTHSDTDITNPVWSPDNRQILFTSHNGYSAQLGIMNADGTDVRPLTSNYSDNHGYSFSPDGSTIAYGSNLNNRDEIFTCNLQTREVKLLLASDDVAEKVKPAYSPQGHLLVFSSDELEHKVHQLYILNLDTHGCERITRDSLDHNSPFVSPDGTKIAYTVLWNGAWNIFTMDINGSNIRNLTESTWDNYSPTWR